MRPILLSLLLSSSAVGQVVVGENVRFTNEPADFHFDIGNVAFAVGKVLDTAPPCEVPSGTGCFSQVAMDYSDGVISLVGSYADEGSEWYVVNPGDRFVPSTRESFPMLFARFGFYSFGGPQSVGSDFYLGVRAGGNFRTIAPPQLSDRTAYGWVHLREVDGKLSMVGNAMAYGAGIIVGTNTPIVPEPSTLLLLALAQWPALFRYVRR